MDTVGHYYPLFFHDEAVALAAGHRPCGTCRPDALSAFICSWKVGHGRLAQDWVPLTEIDEICHQARVSERKARRRERLCDMPEGAFLSAPEIDHRPLLLFADRVWPWQHGGYDDPLDRAPFSGWCWALTSAEGLAALRGGYKPVISPELQRVAKSPPLKI